MTGTIGLPEILIVGVLCCLPTAVAAGLAALLARMRAQKKPNP